MVHPRDASTVVLVRPGGDGSFEILLTRRPQEMAGTAGDFVTEHPLKALAIAFVAGMIVGRIVL